ncbi:prepilin peptidase [Catenulispora acidiphila]|uniref:prepilin peptidase n=1 Tax=Catenulispora acidiphila TaxID=304895 RepID=UPI00117DCBB7|nr:prepilin peptidase [Catenulispora acidiphila]
MTTDAPAIALGAAVGTVGGLYAPRAVRLAIAKGPDGDSSADGLPRVVAALIVTSAAVAGALVGARFGLQARVPAYLYLAAITPALAAVDATTHILPNRIVLPAYPLTVALLAFAAWRASGPGALWRALAAGALLYVIFLAVALVAPPDSLGWGDVKLVGLLGLCLGFLGWKTTWRGMMLAFGLAALCVMVRLLVRHEQRSHALPLGPALLLGSLAAVIIS